MNKNINVPPEAAKKKIRKPIFSEIAAVPHTVWSVLFIVLPLIFVCYYAFTDSEGALTFDNILALSSHAHTFLTSICYAFIATVICLVVGYPLAFSISQASAKRQGMLIMLLMIPMWMNLLIRTYSLMALLDNGGLLNSLLESWGLNKIPIVGTNFGVILGMVYDFLPYMVLPIFTSMTKLDVKYIEASHDLGCNSWQTMTKVVMPLTASGVISGITMVFVPSISTFYISQKLGAGKIDLVGDTIERLFQNTATYGVGAAMSLIMMILILISVGVMNRFSNDGDDNAASRGGIIK